MLETLTEVLMMVTAKELRSRAYHRGCRGKARYSTEPEAAREAIRRRTRVVLTFPGHCVRHYRCSFGAHWHVGHTQSFTREGRYQ